MRRARSHASRAACRNSVEKSNAPASPCTGSMITAAVDESTAAFSAAMSSRGTNCTSNGVRGNPYHDLSAPQVTAAAAAVRPWKLCSIATIFGRPVTLSATRSAFSFASAPLLTKNTRPTPGRREFRERVGRLVANLERQRVRLEHEVARRARDRFGQARMAVAERRDRVPAVEIEHAPARARPRATRRRPSTGVNGSIV